MHALACGSCRASRSVWICLVCVLAPVLVGNQREVAASEPRAPAAIFGGCPRTLRVHRQDVVMLVGCARADGGTVFTLTSPADGDDSQGTLEAWSARNGKKRWQVALRSVADRWAVYAPWKQVALDGSVALFNDEDSRLYCFDAATGSLRWRLQVPSYAGRDAGAGRRRIWLRGTVASGSGAVMSVILEKTGKILGRWSESEAAEAMVPVADDKVLVLRQDGTALLARFGQQAYLWQRTVKALVGGYGVQLDAAAASVLVVADVGIQPHDRHVAVVALSVQDGRELWSLVLDPKKDKDLATGMGVHCVRAIGPDWGIAYGPVLTRLSAQNGRRLWSFRAKIDNRAGGALFFTTMGKDVILGSGGSSKTQRQFGVEPRNVLARVDAASGRFLGAEVLTDPLLVEPCAMDAQLVLWLGVSDWAPGSTVCSYDLKPCYR